MTDKKNLGNRGEALAQKYLAAAGYELIATNFRTGRREVDLIARRGRKTVFFEIKTRIKRGLNPNDDGTDCLSIAQTHRLKQALSAYCRENRLSGEAVRLDLIIISVNPKNSRADLKHYRDIF